MSTNIDQIEDGSIYVTLSLRGAQPGFHWGVFVPMKKPKGDFWHAVNYSGGWSLEIKTTARIATSRSLCLLFKVGTVTNQNWDEFKATLGNVPGTGQPSLNTQEAFTCRIWVKDALVALQNAGFICLTKPIDAIEQAAVKEGEDHRTHVELGEDGAYVWNDTGFFS
ncbi:MAG: hypothetical protein Q9227_001019 [Pyrenula ochraceoflavens]